MTPKEKALIDELLEKDPELAKKVEIIEKKFDFPSPKENPQVKK